MTKYIIIIYTIDTTILIRPITQADSKKPLMIFNDYAWKMSAKLKKAIWEEFSG